MRSLRARQIASVILVVNLSFIVLAYTTAPSPPDSLAFGPPVNSILAGELENFSLTASFVAGLQGADGGMEEAEDNVFENTDNTLEAIWIWCRYYRATGDNQYFPNVLSAWNYSVNNTAWTEFDSGRVYSSGWAVLAEREYRLAYGLTDMMWYANQSATYIISRNGWEEPILPFDNTAKRHIMGWGAGSLYTWAKQLGNASAAQSAVNIGNLLRIAVESDTSLLGNESWALAGGASFWGIATTYLAENPNASWVNAHAPFMKAVVPDPGVGPGRSQNGWEAWYALGWWAAYNATGDQTYLGHYQNITGRLITRDGDRDGGVPTNVGDPDDGDESWVTAYRAYFCLRQGISIYDIRPPGPPSIVSIEVTDTSNVTLTWNLSSDDGTGTGDVQSYEILASEVFEPEGTGYQLLDALVNGTSTYVHAGAGSDGLTHFYLVVAKDVEGFTSGSEQAVKFSRQLAPGMNLVSVPLLAGDVPIEDVLAGVAYDAVRKYDGAIDRPWLLYTPDRGYQEDLALNISTAVWLNVLSQSEIIAAGLVPESATIHLKSGWNLIGFTSFASNFTVSTLKSQAAVLRVEGFSAIDLPYQLKALNDSELLSAGSGYWVEAQADCVVTIWT